MNERQPKTYVTEEVMGEYPAYIQIIPGEIRIDNVSHPDNIEELSNDHLEKHPKIMRGARKFGKDLVTFVSSHGRGLLIGGGLALLVGAGAYKGCKIIYRSKTRDRR